MPISLIIHCVKTDKSVWFNQIQYCDVFLWSASAYKALFNSGYGFDMECPDALFLHQTRLLYVFHPLHLRL